jgi:hypothetical protein
MLKDDDPTAVDAMIQFIYTQTYEPDGDSQTQEQAEKHCDVAIVADKYIVPDLVDESLKRLMHVLAPPTPAIDTISILNKLWSSGTGRNPIMCVKVVRFWLQWNARLAQYHAEDRIRELLFKHPDFATHIAAAMIGATAIHACYSNTCDSVEQKCNCKEWAQAEGALKASKILFKVMDQ